MKASLHHAYIVKWRDSASLAGWKHISTQHSVSEITSIGWMIRQDKRSLTLTTSISDCASTMDAITIPREAVTRMTRLKYHVAGS